MGDFPLESTGEPAPWDGDERLKSAYMANKKFILSKGESGLVKKSINFPADNLITTTDIVRIVEDITRGEKMAFRFNISIGFILRHIETGEYRYFIPDRNETLFPHTHTYQFLERRGKESKITNGFCKSI